MFYAAAGLSFAEMLISMGIMAIIITLLMNFSIENFEANKFRKKNNLDTQWKDKSGYANRIRGMAAELDIPLGSEVVSNPLSACNGRTLSSCFSSVMSSSEDVTVVMKRKEDLVVSNGNSYNAKLFELFKNNTHYYNMTIIKDPSNAAKVVFSQTVSDTNHTKAYKKLQALIEGLAKIFPDVLNSINLPDLAADGAVGKLGDYVSGANAIDDAKLDDLENLMQDQEDGYYDSSGDSNLDDYPGGKDYCEQSCTTAEAGEFCSTITECGSDTTFQSYTGDTCRNSYTGSSCYQSYTGSNCYQSYTGSNCYNSYAGYTCHNSYTGNSCYQSYTVGSCSSGQSSSYCQTICSRNCYQSCSQQYNSGSYNTGSSYNSVYTTVCQTICHSNCYSSCSVQNTGTICTPQYTTVCTSNYTQVCTSNYTRVCTSNYTQVCTSNYTPVCTSNYTQVCTSNFVEVQQSNCWETQTCQTMYEETCHYECPSTAYNNTTDTKIASAGTKVKSMFSQYTGFYANTGDAKNIPLNKVYTNTVSAKKTNKSLNKGYAIGIGGAAYAAEADYANVASFSFSKTVQQTTTGVVVKSITFKKPTDVANKSIKVRIYNKTWCEQVKEKCEQLAKDPASTVAGCGNTDTVCKKNSCIKKSGCQ